MYTFTQLLSGKDLLTRQVPTLLVALVIAEVLYKFGSFTLEAVAFLATWFVLDAALSKLIEQFRTRSTR